MRVKYRTYVLTLCMFYLALTFVFHSRLQYNINLAEVLSQDNSVSLISRHHRTAVIHNHSRVSVAPVIIKNDQKYDLLNSSVNQYQIQKSKDFVQNLDFKYVSPSKQSFTQKESTLTDFCEHQVSGHDTVFQAVTPNKNFLYSAYFDDRKGTSRFIRIISIMRDKPALFCHFNVSGNHQATAVTYYEMCENHGRSFKGYILSCLVPSGIVSVCSVQVSASPRPGSTGKVTLYVHSVRKRPQMKNFSVCVPPLFGKVDKNTLVEFIELSRLLGAEHFTFYNFQLQVDVLNVLKFYQNQKVLSIIPWELPIHVDRAVWYHGQLVSIEDCLYRNMAATHFLAFNDIDEFIVPRSLKGWMEMIESIHSEENCGYVFQSVFFDPERARQSQLNNSLSYLRMARNTVRSQVISKVRTKCLVRPRRIFEIGIHHISKPNEESYKVVRVDQKVALLHHYRKCLADFGMRCQVFVQDDTLNKFSEQLHNQVQTVFSQVSPH